MPFDVITYSILKKKKADLNDLGKVPAEQLPSYVDSIIEVTNKAALPATGQTGRIYAINTGTGEKGDRKGDCYRWSGSQYVLIGDPDFYNELGKKQDKLTPGKGISIYKSGDKTIIKINFTTFDIKGSVEYYANLPTSGMDEGDTYYVKNDDPDLTHTKGFYMWLEETTTVKYWLKIDVDTQWGKILGDIEKQTDLIGLINLQLPRDGSRAMTGDLNASNHKVTNVVVGGNDDAVPKSYVDSADNKKVDKSTESVTEEKAYFHGPGQTEGTMTISGNASANSIARRTPEGHIRVALTPTENNQATSKKYVDDEIAKKNPVIECIELTGGDGATGTLTDAQIKILKASELNYIWLNGMHRLDFKYKDSGNNKATYCMSDLSSDGIKYHSVEVNLSTKAYKIYHSIAVKDVQTRLTEDGTYESKMDEHGLVKIDLSEVSPKVDDTTIEKDPSTKKLKVKDGGISLAKLQKQNTADVGKTITVKTDGTWELSNITQYKRVSSFASPLVGNTYTWYYLDKDYVTAGKTYKIGNYIYDITDGFVLAADVGGGSGASPLYLGIVNPGGSFPTKRPDNTALVIGDYVKPKPDATFPYTVAGITFTSAKDVAVFMSAPNNWLLNASVYQKTSDTPVYDKTNESIDGDAIYQADINKQNAPVINAAVTSATFYKAAVGQVKMNLKNRKNGDVLDATINDIVFTDDNQTLTNKSIDSDNNNITNIITDDLKSSIFDKNELYTTDHTHLASSKLIAKAIEDSKRGFTFTGYVSSSAPTSTIREGELWYNTTSTEMPTVFPINVYTYKDGAWSSTTTAYTPKSLDLWANKNNGHGYYYFGNAWNLLDFNVGVDNTSIDYNNSNQLEVKDGGITLSKFATCESTDVNKVYSINDQGKTILRRVNQYKEVGTFDSLQGDIYTEYYLSTACVVGTQTYGVGLYIWDATDGFVLVANTGGGGSTSTPIFVGIVPPDGSFPTTRGDGSALLVGDYVKPKQDADFPYTVAGVTFNSYKDTAVYMSENNWLINASSYQKTNDTPIASKALESIDGSASSADYQSDINRENAGAINAAAYTGTFEKDASGNIKLDIKNRTNTTTITGTIEKVVFTDDIQTLKNKTINADDNTISELELDNFKTGVVQNEVREKDYATDTSISTEKAVRTELDKLKIQVTVMPTASGELAGKVYQYIGATTATYTQGYFYLCTVEGTGYKWVNLPTSPVFEDVTALPSTNINSGIIYRMHSVSVVQNRYDMTDSTRYIVSTAGITDNNTGDTTPWILVSSQWNTKWQLLVTANPTSGSITKYALEGSQYVIDSISYSSIDKYSLFYYIDGTWHAVGSGADGSGDYPSLEDKPQINAIEVNGNKDSYSYNIFWKGTQSQYDAIPTAQRHSYTMYVVDDGTAGGGTAGTSGYSKAEVDALLLLKQNINDTTLETVSKQVVPAINELFNDFKAFAGGISIKVVDSQPASPTNNTIYYIGTVAPYVVKLYTVTSGWTDLGTTDIDLTDYQKKEVTITDYTATTVEGILSEIKTLLNQKLTADDVVNALDSTATNKALSAYQGNLLAAQVNLRVKTEDVINALDSTSTVKPLSANKGRELKELIDTKQNKVTISPADPTGGVDGDLWFKITE